MKIHCSVLAEDAIKAAIDDYKEEIRAINYRAAANVTEGTIMETVTIEKATSSSDSDPKVGVRLPQQQIQRRKAPACPHRHAQGRRKNP